MAMLSKTAIGIAAVCGSLFLSYCVYFDRKRRSDPDFKKKLRERRKANREKSVKSNVQLPDLRNHEACQAFFLQQVQLGEELLGQGNVEEGIEHLGNAVAVCGQPNHLLQVFQQTLPQQVFQLLLQRLPMLTQRIMEQPCGPAMAEEDVE